MTDTVTVRRLDATEAAEHIDALADVLIDCVEGGASVSFMQPMTRTKAIAFWRKVADGVACGERALLVAQDHEALILVSGFGSAPLPTGMRLTVVRMK